MNTEIRMVLTAPYNSPNMTIYMYVYSFPNLSSTQLSNILEWFNLKPLSIPTVYNRVTVYTSRTYVKGFMAPMYIAFGGLPRYSQAVECIECRIRLMNLMVNVHHHRTWFIIQQHKSKNMVWLYWESHPEMYTLKLLQPKTTPTMFLPMSCTSPLTVAMMTTPALLFWLPPFSLFSSSMYGMRWATAFFMTLADLMTCSTFLELREEKYLVESNYRVDNILSRSPWFFGRNKIIMMCKLSAAMPWHTWAT